MASNLLQHVAPGLTALGGLVALYHAYKVATFINVHFLHRSALRRYLKTRKGDEAGWALVTGSTDGIGKGFAEELCHRGFNIVLHGRNESKLENLEKCLSQKYPKSQIRILRIDAAQEASSPEAFSRAVTSLSDIDLKILINNVGGSSGLPSFVPLSERTSEQVGAFMDVNARFPTEITRALLPLLQKSSPALVMNIGSCTSEFGIPYLSVYSGCKAYNKGWSESLASEMQAEKTGVEVLCIMVSAVATDSYPKSLSVLIPSARKMASSALEKVGCGRSVVFGYWGHQVQALMMDYLPASVTRRAVIDIGKQEKVEEEERFRGK